MMGRFIARMIRIIVPFLPVTFVSVTFLPMPFMAGMMMGRLLGPRFQVLDLHSDRFAVGRHWSIHACSAVTGEGLVDGIDWMVRDISSRIFMMS